LITLVVVVLKLVECWLQAVVIDCICLLLAGSEKFVKDVKDYPDVKSHQLILTETVNTAQNHPRCRLHDDDDDDDGGGVGDDDDDGGGDDVN